MAQAALQQQDRSIGRIVSVTGAKAIVLLDGGMGGAGRGVARGLIYDRSGQQIATVVQEIAMRVVQPDEG